MVYLIAIFIVIIVVGILANHELATDKQRIKNMMREYSYRTYSPDKEKEQNSEKKENKQE